MFQVKQLAQMAGGVAEKALTPSNFTSIEMYRVVGLLLWPRPPHQRDNATARILNLPTVSAILVFSSVCLGQTNAADKRFIASVWQTGVVEVELAKLAQNKSIA